MRQQQQIVYSLYCLITLIFTSCNKTDWRENYREKSKQPFGTYIIYNEAKQLFNDNDVNYLNKNIYDYFDYIYYDNESDYANYICIKSSAYKVNDLGVDRLLEFVNAGNDVFFALNYFDENIKEKLKFKTINFDEHVYQPEHLKGLNSIFSLVNKAFDKTDYTYDRNIRKHYFSEIDSSSTTVLGTQHVDTIKKPNFIKIKYGNGAVFLHTQPIAFTNYYLLNNNNYSYVEQVLSYLPDITILWDPQIKRSITSLNTEKETSVFKFFLKHDSLKWSLGLGFTGLLMFLVFNARRKQRAMPVLSKLKNSTQDFTHTIANLYLKEDNHKNLVSKKITYFLAHVRSLYKIDTNKLNNTFIEKLAARSGNTFNTTKYLINTFKALDKKSECTQDELIRLNMLIDNFFENNK